MIMKKAMKKSGAKYPKANKRATAKFKARQGKGGKTTPRGVISKLRR